MSIALHDAVAAVAPIKGISIGRTGDRSTWVVHYAETATPAEIAAAKKVLASFVLTPSPTSPEAILAASVRHPDAIR